MNTPTRGANEYSYSAQREIIIIVKEWEVSLHGRHITDIIFQVTIEFWSTESISNKGTTETVALGVGFKVFIPIFSVVSDKRIGTAGTLRKEVRNEARGRTRSRG